MSASAEASRKIFVRAGRSHGRTRSRGCRTRDSRRWEDGREKRRAWVQGGLGTSATRHARRLMGSRSSSRSAAGHAARATCFFELDLAFRRRDFVTHGRGSPGKRGKTGAGNTPGSQTGRREGGKWEGGAGEGCPGGEPALGVIAKCDYDFRQGRPAVDADDMHVISRSRLRLFWKTCRNRADAERALSAWYKIASKAEWANFAGLKQTFGSADKVGNCVVFDVGNNRYRLIGRVFYPHRLYVLRVMDHEEYDRVPWASQCGCHSPPPKSRTPPAKRPAHTGRQRR
jgi:mRNA interferase HigB